MKDKVQGKQPLQDRLRQMGRAEGGENRLPDDPVTYFALGAGLLAGTRYPEWLMKRLMELYHAPPGYPYRDLVGHADRMLRQEATERQGYELMYQLLIEPFYLMQKKEESVCP